MPQTITGFTTFVDDTKARASEVNENFSNFRGDLLPVDMTTAAAVDLAYDLGSTEYRWQSAYVSNIYLGQTTTSWFIKDETTAVADLEIYQNSVLKFRVPESPYTLSSGRAAAEGNTQMTTTASTLYHATGMECTVTVAKNEWLEFTLYGMTSAFALTSTELQAGSLELTGGQMWYGITYDDSILIQQFVDASNQVVMAGEMRFVFQMQTSGTYEFKVFAFPDDNNTFWDGFGKLMVRRMNIYGPETY